MYAKFPKKLLFLTPMIRTRTYVYQEVRNVSFSRNFMYVLNEWFLNNEDSRNPASKYIAKTPRRSVNQSDINMHLPVMRPNIQEKGKMTLSSLQKKIIKSKCSPFWVRHDISCVSSLDFIKMESVNKIKGFNLFLAYPRICKIKRKDNMI